MSSRLGRPLHSSGPQPEPVFLPFRQPWPGRPYLFWPQTLRVAAQRPTPRLRGVVRTSMERLVVLATVATSRLVERREGGWRLSGNPGMRAGGPSRTGGALGGSPSTLAKFSGVVLLPG